jgi:hypothetical protein
MIIIDGKEITTLKEAAKWLRDAWCYEPYNIYYEEDGNGGCIEVEASRDNPGAESYTIYSLEEFRSFIGE